MKVAKMNGIAVATAAAALFLAAPQPDANRAPRLNVQRLQNAHCFERDDRARAVIGSSGAGENADIAADIHFPEVVIVQIAM